jgi:hypothetical protein
VIFPGADRTFAVWRETITTDTDGYNQKMTRVLHTTGVPIHLRDLNAVVNSETAGRENVSVYRGSCRKTTDIRVGDVLKDETENYPDGTPVQYEVVGATKNFAYLKLHLMKTSFT